MSQQQRVVSKSGAGVGPSERIPSFCATGSTTTRNNNNNSNNDDGSDSDSDGESRKQESDLLSAELIRRAARNIKALAIPNSELSTMSAYVVRCASRELVDIILGATERSFHPISDPKVLRLLKTGGSSSAHNNDKHDFLLLKGELDRILQQVSDFESLAARSSREIQQIWASTPGLRYTPLDLLDVIIIGGGAGAATSNMTMDALRILHRHWISFANTNGKKNVQAVSPAAAAAAAAVDDSSKLKGGDAELSEDYLRLLNEMRVPQIMITKIFELLSPLALPVRSLRIMSSIARINALSTARNYFTASLHEAAAIIGPPIPPSSSSSPSLSSAKNDQRIFGQGCPPEICDLAEGAFLAQLKSYELACGVPYFIDRKLAVVCRLCEPVATSEAESVQVSVALSRILKELPGSSSSLP